MADTDRVYVRASTTRVNDASWAPDVAPLEIGEMGPAFLEDLRELLDPLKLASAVVEHSEFPLEDADREEREINFIVSLSTEDAEALLADEDAVEQFGIDTITDPAEIDRLTNKDR
jgi:hypothetical protein